MNLKFKKIYFIIFHSKLSFLVIFYAKVIPLFIVVYTVIIHVAILSIRFSSVMKNEL